MEGLRYHQEALSENQSYRFGMEDFFLRTHYWGQQGARKVYLYVSFYR